MSLRCFLVHLVKHSTKYGTLSAGFQRTFARQASGAAKAIAEQDASDPISSDAAIAQHGKQSHTHHRLPPVPPLRRAIFRLRSESPTAEDAPALARYVDSTLQDRSRYISRIWDENSLLLSASSFNAVTARLSRSQEAPTLPQIFFGMLCAAGDPAAMHQCFKLLEQINDRDTLPKDYRYVIFPRIVDSICSQPESTGSDWHRGRVGQQWLRVVTGWESHGLPRDNLERRQLCFYSIGAANSGKLWKTYLRLLSRFGDANVVYNEWVLYQQSKPFEITDGESDEASRNTAAVAKCAVNATARALVRSGDAKRAWQVMYDFGGDLAATVEDASLDTLMAYPQYIREWLPFMEGPALSVLERELQRVEGYLGLSWEGGEDGFHRPRDG